MLHISATLNLCYVAGIYSFSPIFVQSLQKEFSCNAVGGGNDGFATKFKLVPTKHSFFARHRGNNKIFESKDKSNSSGRKVDFFSAVTRKEKNSLETTTKTMKLNDLQRLVISCHSCHVMSPNPIRILIQLLRSASGILRVWRKRTKLKQGRRACPLFRKEEEEEVEERKALYNFTR